MHVSRLRCFFLVSALLAAPPTLSAQEGAPGTDPGFEPLFQDSSLRGWSPVGNAGFTNKNGTVTCTGTGNYPSWLRSEQEFENFILRFEFSLDRYSDGGIFFHAPKYGRNSRVGFEFQLSDDKRSLEPLLNSNGAIYGAVPPSKFAFKDFGIWNDAEITVDWPKFQAKINGETVQDLDLSKDPRLAHRFRSGFLGLQDRGNEYRLRNVRVQRLPNSDKPWRTLFNGKDFTGWHEVKEGAKFTVDNGEILAEDGNGYLVTNDKFTNFELRLYVKTKWLANGGVFIRWLGRDDRGDEIQVEDIPDSRNPTGSVYDRAHADDLPIQIGEWYPMQIMVDGPNVTVRVNGKTVAHYDRLNVRAGHIALQMHKRDSWIRFSDIQIQSWDK
ncbi:MAG: DUF1080 domain-containing protein [Planctomycetota bacterium]